MTTRQSSEPNKNEAAIQRERVMRGDARFKHAMLNARRWKRERFTIGVDTRPGTERPQVIEAKSFLEGRSAVADF